MGQNHLTVSTVCFNNLEELQRTCASVDSQERLPFEHLIIDGSTKPDIRHWLEHSPQPAHRRWICEPDRGIADAFNKGITQARGDIIHLLNSGDYYYDRTVVRRMLALFETQPQLMWANGLMAYHRGGTWLINGTAFDRQLLYRGMRTLGHQTFFVRKEVYERHGLFDLSRKVAMDTDLLMRIADEPAGHLAYPVSVFTPGGTSEVKLLAGLREAREAYEKYHGFSLKARLWMWRTFLIAWMTGHTLAGRIFFRWKNRRRQILHPQAPDQ